MATADITHKVPRPRNQSSAPARGPGRRRTADEELLREMFGLIRPLQLTMAVVSAAVKALERQAAEQDEDIALVLRRHVCDALAVHIEKWDELLRLKGMRLKSVNA